jgi:GNAT superfamily N-acetyltransferase
MTVVFAEANQTGIPLILDMMQDFNLIYGYPFDRKQVANNLKLFIASKHLGQIWTIHCEGLIIGYVVLANGFSFEYGGHDAFVDEFFLKEEYRSLGIGARTIDFVSAQAKILNINALHLEVELDNITARNLYLKKGFVDNKRTLLTKRL